MRVGRVSIAVPFDDRWFFSEVIKGATREIETAGHTPAIHVISPSPSSTAAAVGAIEQDFADSASLGAIVVGFKYPDDQRTRILARQRPLVLIGGSVLEFPTVMIDDVGASFAATDHLMQLGHHRIAHFAGDLRDQMDFSVHGRRARGYRLAMERAGYDPVMVECAFDYDDVYAKATQVLQSTKRPSAVFAVSDEVAYPVMDAARDLQLELGKDLSVIGFDDHPLAVEKDLTTMRQRPHEHGAAAASLLLSGIGDGPNPRRSRLMTTSLVQRASTGRRR